LLFLSKIFHTIDQLSVDVAISVTSSKSSSQFLLHPRTKLHQGCFNGLVLTVEAATTVRMMMIMRCLESLYSCQRWCQSKYIT